MRRPTKPGTDLLTRIRRLSRRLPNGCVVWVGVYDVKYTKKDGTKKGRPRMRLGRGMANPARIMKSIQDGVPLDEREGLDCAHVKCRDTRCINPEHTEWMHPGKNRGDERTSLADFRHRLTAMLEGIGRQ